MRGPLVAYAGATPAARAEGLALARFLEPLLVAVGGWDGVELCECPGDEVPAARLLAETASAGALPFPVLSLDLAAAAALAHARQTLLLRDRGGAMRAAFSGDADRALALLRLLRLADGVVAFAPATAEQLRQLGCRVDGTLPAPALPPRSAPGAAATPAAASHAPRSVLVVNHLGATDLAHRAVALLRRAVGGGAMLVGVNEAPAPGLDAVSPWQSEHPRAAVAHVHLGAPGSAAAPDAPRVVDSFACRRPVLLHLAVGVAAATPGETPPPPVQHETDGLVSTDEVGLMAAMHTMLDDEFFAGLMARNAERVVVAFNQRVAGALREALPNVFGPGLVAMGR